MPPASFAFSSNVLPRRFFCPNGSNRQFPQPIQCVMSRNRFVQNVTWAATLLVLACWSLSSVAQSLPSNPPVGITKLNHIIFRAQENRSLDHYFGELRQYWADNGYADRSFDGLPQFNPASGLLPHYRPPATNPRRDPAFAPP